MAYLAWRERPDETEDVFPAAAAGAALTSPARLTWGYGTPTRSLTCPRRRRRVHTLPGHAARAVAAANKTIRALIILAGVICGDETPLRAGPGPKIRKKYLQVACTNLLTCYFLGDRDLARCQGLRLQRRLGRHQPPAVLPAPTA